MRLTCTRRVQFCAGHRLLEHESKCAHLHGHNYVALFEAKAEGLDSVGRVIDFAVLKEKLGGWIERAWDHGFIVNEHDAEALRLLEHLDKASPNGQKYATLPYNPTAENLALHLGEAIAPRVLQGSGVRVVRVTVWETENCFATWELER